MNNYSQDLLDNARKLEDNAYKVIESIKLIESWEKAGKPVLVGSVRFGLMSSPNIDIEIYTEIPNIQAGFDIIKDLASQPGVEQIKYTNFIYTADPGLYWKIDYRDNDGIVWDIDNWLVPFSHPHAGLANSFASAMETTLTDDIRLTILKLKSLCQKETGARGIDFYRAVIDDNVQEVDDFKRWLRNNQRDGIDTWQPSNT